MTDQPDQTGSKSPGDDIREKLVSEHQTSDQLHGKVGREALASLFTSTLPILLLSGQQGQAVESKPAEAEKQRAQELKEPGAIQPAKPEVDREALADQLISTLMRDDLEQEQRKFFWNIGISPGTNPTNEQFENAINKQLTGERRQFWLDEFRKETDHQIQAKLRERVTHHTIERELMGTPAEKEWQKFLGHLGLDPGEKPNKEQIQAAIDKQPTEDRRQFWLDEFKLPTDKQIEETLREKLQERLTEHNRDKVTTHDVRKLYAEFLVDQKIAADPEGDNPPQTLVESLGLTKGEATYAQLEEALTKILFAEPNVDSEINKELKDQLIEQVTDQEIRQAFKAIVFEVIDAKIKENKR